jgi:hypothetical protein
VFDGEVEGEFRDTGKYLRVRRRERCREAVGGRGFAGAEHGSAVSVARSAPPGEYQAPHVDSVEEDRRRKAIVVGNRRPHASFPRHGSREERQVRRTFKYSCPGVSACAAGFCASSAAFAINARSRPVRPRLLSACLIAPGRATGAAPA